MKYKYTYQVNEGAGVFGKETTLRKAKKQLSDIQKNYPKATIQRIKHSPMGSHQYNALNQQTGKWIGWHDYWYGDKGEGN